MSGLACVYAICNTVTGEAYIGRARRLKQRWKAHRDLLEREKHFNVGLQASWQQHGERAFTLLILTRRAETEGYDSQRNALYQLEHYWIAEALKHGVKLYNDRNNEDRRGLRRPRAPRGGAPDAAHD